MDLPGYGFAQAPEQVVKQWQKVIFAYLQGRVNLKRVFLLIDSRHGIKKVDQDIMEMLDKAAVTYQIVLTKTDKISAKALAEDKEKNRGESGKTRCRLCKSSGNQFGKKHRYRRAAGGNILPDINSCAFSQNSIS